MEKFFNTKCHSLAANVKIQTNGDIKCNIILLLPLASNLVQKFLETFDNIAAKLSPTETFHVFCPLLPHSIINLFLSVARLSL